jgi:hypothetical protein
MMQRAKDLDSTTRRRLFSTRKNAGSILAVFTYDPLLVKRRAFKMILTEKGISNERKRYQKYMSNLTLSAAIPAHFSENGVRRESVVPVKDLISHIRLLKIFNNAKNKRSRQNIREIREAFIERSQDRVGIWDKHNRLIVAGVRLRIGRAIEKIKFDKAQQRNARSHCSSDELSQASSKSPGTFTTGLER